jgi:hypothetical protein
VPRDPFRVFLLGVYLDEGRLVAVELRVPFKQVDYGHDQFLSFRNNKKSGADRIVSLNISSCADQKEYDAILNDLSDEEKEDLSGAGAETALRRGSDPVPSRDKYRHAVCLASILMIRGKKSNNKLCAPRTFAKPFPIDKRRAKDYDIDVDLTELRCSGSSRKAG